MREKMHAKQVEAFSEFRLITLILLVITGSQGRLTDVPKNNLVSQGATAEFTCCSDIQEPLFWKVKHISSPYIEYIYDDGLVNGFRNNGRFSVIDGNRSGCYRLVIADVRANDAGTYLCVDEQGLGQQMGWELAIVESLDCQEKYRQAEYMGENKFGLPEDVIFTVCISKYIGNIPPKTICEWFSGTQIFDNHQHVTDTNVTTILTIQMPARKEFNGDQLSCYLKIDGKASDNQTMTAWRSSHLIINYASFHQRGVSKCSVDDLFLDCQPPCKYKTIRSSNGLSYCEITYPSKTHKKVFVSLQDNTLISSTASLPVENHSTGILPFVTAGLVSVLICCALAGATTSAIIILKRKIRQRQNMAKFVPDSNRERRQRQNMAKFVPGSNRERRQQQNMAKFVPGSNRERRQQQNMAKFVPGSNRERRQRQNMAKFVPGSNRARHTISRPGIVINMGDGNTVPANIVHGDQQGSVTMKQENSPLLRAFNITDLSRTSTIPFSEPDNASVRGVAILGEHLFFAYRGSSQVRVYSANTLGYKTSWELNELTRPQDITACSKSNCLYICNVKVTGSEYIKQADSEYIELTDREYIEITDSGYIKLTGSECDILKISPQGCLIETWNTGINHFGRLSVTHDANVVLAVHCNGTLVEYTTDGTLLRKIQLPDALRPIYALKVRPDYYFVSYGFNEDLEHGVCNVDANGQVLKRFGQTKGSTNQQLNNPVHLVMNDESIWVADSKNGRVVVLSPTLEYKGTLLSKEDELSCPIRICIDQANRRLLLSDCQNQNHFLRVFNFI